MSAFEIVRPGVGWWCCAGGWATEWAELAIMIVYIALVAPECSRARFPSPDVACGRAGGLDASCVELAFPGFWVSGVSACYGGIRQLENAKVKNGPRR